MEQPEQLHKTTERLGTESITKLLFRLSLPSIVSMLAITIYGLIDTYWVARLGYQSIAALTILMPFWVIIIAIGAGTGVGANALASRRFGERKPEEANRIAGQTFLLATFLGCILIAIIQIFPRQIMIFSGATPDIIHLGMEYLLMLSWGMPFLLFNTMLRGIYHASGDTLRPMIFTIASQVCNIILDPFLILGWGVFPMMGVSGAALATVISLGLGAFVGRTRVCHGSIATVCRNGLKPDIVSTEGSRLIAQIDLCHVVTDDRRWVLNAFQFLALCGRIGFHGLDHLAGWRQRVRGATRHSGQNKNAQSVSHATPCLSVDAKHCLN